ncbi:MAG: hypothetical protein GTO63_06445, partial [Anaerolineae bacterium]|nr:hypothetical protein [Anaerolineae bacterium]NIN94612.1 hypothetical protein [Anaerolineae bacterium]NIQ77668.1 hypothetical protein [Anaerolineae bacterium]
MQWFSLIRRTFDFLAALLILLAILLLLTRSAAGAGVNLTQNWGFEDGFKPNGVGLGWKRFVLKGNVSFANTIEYFWPGAEHTEGETSQLIISKTAFTAGIYQQISGVTPGQHYGAKAAMLTFFESPAPPTNDGTMQKLVGIDPYGGTDPNSPNIVWSLIDDHDEGPWVRMGVAVVAQASTITLFVRVNCLQPVSHPPSLDNQVFIDAVMLAQAPTVSASSPPVSYSPTFTVTWEDGQAAPGGHITKYDVQYKDDVNDEWVFWHETTTLTSDLFTGVVGRTYTFRARARQLYTDWYDIRLYGAWSDGDSSTYVTTIGGVQGYVRDNRDIRMLGGWVTLVGTGIADDTASGGQYHLVPPVGGTYDVFVTCDGYNSPPEVRGVDLYEPVVELDFTVRPQDDVISNGDFEDGLNGWETVTGSTAAPVAVDDVVRSGDYSLALGEDMLISGDCGITQTVYITPTMYLPTLSFWHRTLSTGGDGNDFFQVGLYQGDPGTYHPLLTVEPVDQWTHAWLDLSSYSGSASIYFNYHREGAQDFVVYLDEVSLGRASGGPHKTYLPLAP